MAVLLPQPEAPQSATVLPEGIFTEKPLRIYKRRDKIQSLTGRENETYG